jgi:hypothetical protein
MRVRTMLVSLAATTACLGATLLAPPGSAAAAGVSGPVALARPVPPRPADTDSGSDESDASDDSDDSDDGGPPCVRPGGTMVAYGHSYLHSPKIGGAATSYATLAARGLKMKPLIRAVDQGTTLDVQRLVRQGTSRWVPGSASLVLIDAGINDIGRRIPTARWTGALRATLDAFATPPVPAILLVRPLQVVRVGHPGSDPKVVAAYAEAQRKVAEGYSAVRIVDAGKDWNPRQDISKDGVHPNSQGMTDIARAVQRSAKGLFCRS